MGVLNIVTGCQSSNTISTMSVLVVRASGNNKGYQIIHQEPRPGHACVTQAGP